MFSPYRGQWPRAVALVVVACLASAGAWADAPVAKPPTMAKTLHLARSYTVTSPPGEQLEMPKPILPDLSGYTAAAVQAKIDRRHPGKLSVRRMMQEDVLKEFVGGNNKMAEWVARQRGIPSALFLDDGHMNLKDLAKAQPNYIKEVSPGVYLARLPIVVGRKGILEIDRQTRELRLSQDRGAFIVNDGKLFISDTRVTGWNEARNAPSSFEQPKTFRPFILAWGGTETYFVNSQMASLGYNQSKSYGISISQYTPNMKKAMNRAAPTGWIIGSEFSDMWYGFYCYETDDFVIKGSVYRDNQVYGIDPHDRSERLIIADNTVYGTRKKHGIIVSREVNDSWIFNNRTYDNHLSGLVVDRNSINNVIADNQIYRNHTDGITLYESGDNLIWGNQVIGNRRHGIRIRNSVNVRLYENNALANGLTGIYGHIKDLSDTNRDIKLDPFDTDVSMIVVGGQLIGNGTSPLAIDSPLSVELYRVAMLAPSKSTGISFSGVMGDNQNRILDLLLRQHKAVLIDPVERQTAVQN